MTLALLLFSDFQNSLLTNNLTNQILPPAHGWSEISFFILRVLQWSLGFFFELNEHILFTILYSEHKNTLLMIASAWWEDIFIIQKEKLINIMHGPCRTKKTLLLITWLPNYVWNLQRKRKFKLSSTFSRLFF
jgi:hypothetical protein